MYVFLKFLRFLDKIEYLKEDIKVDDNRNQSEVIVDEPPTHIKVKIQRFHFSIVYSIMMLCIVYIVVLESYK